MILYSKAKRSVSVLKEQAKVGVDLGKPRVVSAAGSNKGKAGKHLDGNNKGARDSKEAAKKVSKVLTEYLEAWGTWEDINC